MKTTKLAVLLLSFAVCSFASAQTVMLPSTGFATSPTIGGGTSLFLGTLAGSTTNASALANTFAGYYAGKSNTSGTSNVYLGSYAGQASVTSNYNICIGTYAGYTLNSQYGSNVMVGHGTGYSNTNGFGNVFLGHTAGGNTTGSGNVFIGAGVSGGGTSSALFTESDKLMIDNTNTPTPLVWGDFANDQLKLNGKVGIGAVTSFPSAAGAVNVGNYNLFVTGGILTDEVRVNMSSGGTWADYVFAKDYHLKPLKEVENYIAVNGHLPNVPSADRVNADGIALGEMAKIQQEKIEELTLYIIGQDKINQQQNLEIEALKKQVQLLIENK